MVKIKGNSSGKTPTVGRRLSAINDKSTPFKGKKIGKDGQTPKLKKAFELAGGAPKLAKKPDLVGVTPKKADKTPKKEPPKGGNKINIIDMQTIRSPHKTVSKRRNTINAFDAQIVEDLQLAGTFKRRESIAVVENATKTPKRKNGVNDVVETPTKERKTPKGKTPKVEVKTPKEKTVKTPKLGLKTPKVELNASAAKLKKAGKAGKKSPFSELEAKYNVKAGNVEEAIKGVIKFARENPKMQNQLFGEKLPLLLQMGCFKIHKGHPVLVRIPLENSMLTPDDDVCLIVSDIKGLKNKDHDQHLEQYEELLAKKGVKNIRKIMTFHEFRTEYETIELKNRLVDLYDCFLVEGKIGGKVVRKCGKIFYKKRKVPNPVKLRATQLKKQIELSLSKTQFNVTGHGDCYTVQFGHSNMETRSLVENVFSLIEGLDKQFPGGFDNIKNMQIFTQHATPVPIYLDLKDPNEVKVPVLKSKMAAIPRRVKGELSTVTNADVLVSRDGRVKVIKKEEEKGNPDEITIEDLLEDIKRTQKEDATAKGKKKKRKAAKDENDIVVEEENAKPAENKKRKLPQDEPQNGGSPKKKGKMLKSKTSPVKVVPKKKKVQK